MAMNHQTKISPTPITPPISPIVIDEEAKEEPFINQAEVIEVKEVKENKEKVEDNKGKEKFIDKALLKVAILIVAISAASLLATNLMVPNKPMLKIIHKFNIFLTWVTFSVGLACLALCSVFHKPDKNLQVTKFVMWGGLALLELNMALGAFLKMFL